jgi:8-oxo-dGTP diphosphatase
MKVAIAIIYDSNNHVLITQRPLNTLQGGRWEFPGGKVEQQETPDEALIRELQEEIGITVVENTFLGDVNYQYQEQIIQLSVFLINQYQGEPACQENQLGLRWVSCDSLHEIDFPEANREILKLITA